MFDAIFVKEGDLTEDQAQKLFSSLTACASALHLWLLLDEESIINWYLEARAELGKSIRLTDRWRVGHIKCDCQNCGGKVVRKKPFEVATMTPKLKRILSEQGYVNFNAI